MTTPDSLESAIARVKTLANRAQHLMAFDAAQKALESHPDSEELRYMAVLELARSGATLQARDYYAKYALSENLDDPRIGALDARISKDLARRMQTLQDRKRGFRDAAARYAAVYHRSGTCYPAVNAATLFLLGGEPEKSREMANAAVDAASPESVDYYKLATRGEALAVLGRYQEAVEAFEHAVRTGKPDLASVATTRRQMKLLASGIGLDPEVSNRILAALVQPRVAHYCGQLGREDGSVGDLGGDQLDEIKARVRAAVEAQSVGIAYGALAAGADIVLAETLLAGGCRLHVVLPLPVEEFCKVAVTPYGEIWRNRFDACLEQAVDVMLATEEEYLGNEAVFDYGTRLAMGRTLLRARHLSTEAIQFVLWEGVECIGIWSYEKHIRLWQELGFSCEVFGRLGPTEVQAEHAEPDSGSLPRAMLFGDVKGFSRLKERQIPIFIEEVLGRLARVIASYGDEVLFRNTWGDGLFIVVSNADRAASLAFDLQDAMNEIDLDAVGLPADHALRLGAHFGPVHRAEDPVLGIPNYFGAHVSRAARIEPITPEGEIFVSEQFATQLELAKRTRFNSEYVGEVPAAKNYGRLKMYVLRR